MNEKQKSTALDNAEEPMIDSRQASYALHLPYYWFANPKMRAAKRIPHYQLSRLVRFRLSELIAWHRHHASLSGEQACATGGDDE
jgi:hypothetical protein